MKQLIPNEPASPAEYYQDERGIFDAQKGSNTFMATGLSIRAEIAARAMQGILSNGGVHVYNPAEGGHSLSKNEMDIADYAIACADALIKKLNEA